MTWEQRDPNATDRAALEARASIESLDELHQKRRELLIVLAPLKALHAGNGLYDDKRKAFLETQKIAARGRLIDTGNKPTEGMVDAMAYGSEEYGAFLDNGVLARIEYLTRENEHSELGEKIRSRELELSAYTAEARLAR